MTPRFNHGELRELAHQMRFAPAAMRLAQLTAAEQLIDAIEPSRQYPYEFIVFKLTGYRPRGRSDHGCFPGRSLISDLCALVEQVSATLPTRTDELPQTVFTIDDLAERFNVATKTISRWRGRGLACRRIIFPDGKRRVGFLADVVDRFVQKNRRMVARGRQFSHLDARERMEIIEQARKLVAAGATSMHEVACEIAHRTGRAVETIRYTIKRHDENQPDRAVFRRIERGCSSTHEIIFNCFLKGDRLGDLAERFDCTRAAVYRVVMQQRLDRLRARPIEFIYSPEFDLPNADDLILPDGLDVSEIPAPPEPPPRSLPSDIDPLSQPLPGLYDVPLLKRQQERDLFRRFNYLKFKAEQLRASLDDEAKPRHRTLCRIESLLQRAATIRNHLVQANMRLVASIARRHVRHEGQFLEAVSDGSVTLMRAVEKFDYTRGFKFSTYASWAIIRTYARTIPEQTYRRDRFQTGLDELLDAAPDHRGSDHPLPGPDAVRGVLDSMLRILDRREQSIIRQHFGLGRDDGARTLAQISKGMGVSKERIRQIEAKAIKKLRKRLTPQIIDQLFPLGG